MTNDAVNSISRSEDDQRKKIGTYAGYREMVQRMTLDLKKASIEEAAAGLGKDIMSKVSDALTSIMQSAVRNVNPASVASAEIAIDRLGKTVQAGLSGSMGKNELSSTLNNMIDQINMSSMKNNIAQSVQQIRETNNSTMVDNDTKRANTLV